MINDNTAQLENGNKFTFCIDDFISNKFTEHNILLIEFHITVLFLFIEADFILYYRMQKDTAYHDLSCGLKFSTFYSIFTQKISQKDIIVHDNFAPDFITVTSLRATIYRKIVKTSL